MKCFLRWLLVKFGFAFAQNSLNINETFAVSPTREKKSLLAYKSTWSDWVYVSFLFEHSRKMNTQNSIILAENTTSCSLREISNGIFCLFYANLNSKIKFLFYLGCKSWNTYTHTYTGRGNSVSYALHIVRILKQSCD